MATKTPLYLAFRVFGDFHWPFTTEKIDQAVDDPTPENRRNGVIEVYYGGADPNRLVAFIRWFPYSGLAGRALPTPLPEVEAGAFTDMWKISSVELKQRFDQLGEKEPIVFRLAGAAGGQNQFGPRLLFRGAFLFDQFVLDSEIDLRWVLARSYQQQDQGYFSEVVIGQKEDTPATGCRIRFNLALPTPGPQSGTDVKVCFALPFAAIYLPRKAMVKGQAVSVDRFVAGPGPNISVQDVPVDIKVGTHVSDARLGRFGFCGGTKSKGLDFLYFPREKFKKKDYRFGDYWPTDKRAFVEKFLARLSIFRAGAGDLVSPANKPEGTSGELSHSVRFIPADAGSHRTTLVFRTKVEAYAPKLTNDLRVRAYANGRAFALRIPDQTDAWLLTADDTLCIDREVSYELPDSTIWSLTAHPKAGGDLTVRMGFSHKNDKIKPKADEIHIAMLFEQVRAGIRLALLDLRNITAGQPQSILPDIEVDIGKARFMVSGVMPFKFQMPEVNEGTISLIQKHPDRDDWRGIDLSLSLWPQDRAITTEKTDPGLLSANIAISPRSFAYESRTKLQYTLIADPDVATFSPSLWCRFKMVSREGAGKKPFYGRLGGLEFATTAPDPKNIPDPKNKNAGDIDDDQNYSHLRFGYRNPVDAELPAKDFLLTSVDLRLILDVARAVPVSPDIPWGDRNDRAAPLLIPVGENTGEGKFTLDLRETIGESSDRQLTASLYDTGEGKADSGVYVILSEEPFTITRVRSQPLQDRGAQDNALVASFDSDTRQWQVKLTSPTYHYEFPPQVAGESMDKPRRLEIMDYPEAEPAAGPLDPDQATVARPIDRNSNPRAVEFRLAPSAELWIRPSDVERGYFLPEWESHEIFRQRGDLGIGAAMAGLRAEFLYGLSVGIDPASEVGPARSARVAEIEALLGRPPRKLGVSNVSTDLARRWQALDRVIARRPERIEIWARDPATSVPFAPAKFSQGVRFALRNTALHGVPVPLTPDEYKDLNKPGSGRPRVSDKGLSGGALWPLESKNFFKALLERPASQGGTIEQVALSPIGGDANQTAEFLNRKVRIISETRNGFVQRHKIEIIGRISVFWHWAKHVVVYERTVSPSAQFTPERGIKNRTRRPVLRKVSEYIYIRQPQGIRRYPDFEAAGASSSGLLKAVKFNSITIKVDSAWSEDVETYGWKIPLWNRGAAQLRPQVYPRPDIAFTTFAEGQGEEREATQECLEPDNIYFYADASPDTGADTDSWPSLFGIDCSALPPPRAAFEPKLDRKPPSSGDRGPGPSSIPRGHRRFTWRLSPPAKKAALNAGRSEEPLFAALDSITFMRSNAIDIPTAKDLVHKISAAAKIAQFDTVWPPWSDPAAPPPQLSELGGALSDFLDKVKGGSDVDVTTAANILYNQIAAIPAAFKDKDKLKSYSDKLATYGAAIKNIDGFATDGKSRCEKIISDFLDSLKRKQLLILDAIRSWETAAKDHLPEPGQEFATKEKLAEWLVGEIFQIINPALGDVAADVGAAGESIEKARAIVHDVEAILEQRLDAARREIGAIKTTYDFNKPWTPQRLIEFHGKLLSVRDSIIHGIHSAVAEAQSRLAIELDRLAHLIGDQVSLILQALSDMQADTTASVNAMAALATSFLSAIDHKMTFELGDKGRLAQLDKKLADAENKGLPQGALDVIKALRIKIATLRDDGGTIAEARDEIHELAKTIAASTAPLQTAIAQATELLADPVNEIQQFVTDARKQLDDIAEMLGADIKEDLEKGVTRIFEAGDALIGIVSDLGNAADAMADAAVTQAEKLIAAAETKVEEAFGEVDILGNELSKKLEDVKTKLGTEGTSFIRTDILVPALNTVLANVDDSKFSVITDDNLKELRVFLSDLSTNVEAAFQRLPETALPEATKLASEACKNLGGTLEDARELIERLASDAGKQFAEVGDKLKALLGDAAKLRDFAKGCDRDLRQISNDVALSFKATNAYTDRVLEAAGNLGSCGLGAAPGNILRLYAAVASPPALPNLDFARDRLGYYYNQLNEVIDTTPVEAWFGRLGDELKALGLNIPFSQIGDHIIPDDLSKFDIGRIFKNFSGMRLDKLFSGYKLPAGAKDAVKITHSFDKTQLRAWVQIDIDLPMKERKALFRVGPFELDFVESRLLAVVRLETSKDSDKVDQIGRAVLTTNIDAVVGGQSMVMLQRVAVRYEKSSGLKVEFDPKNIKLNSAFRFIQDTLGSLFSDEVGGMKVIKDRGIPVGVEHEFAMPPVSLNFATSGVTNILINNRFALVAFPEFVISDRFSLSKPELPFIFSIFIIGGTGYITVDTEYRPFTDKGLMVTVEAAAGGSAQLAFAFGPVSGSVFITLSIALAYRKVFGRDGGGLTVSLVLLIAGNVNVAGIVNIYIGLMLRMSYRDNGAIDATGTLTVTIRISKFFKISVRANVKYQLRGGQSKTTTSIDSNTEITDPKLKNAADKAKKLLEARG